MDDKIEINGIVYTAGDIENLKAGHDANKEKKERLEKLEKEHAEATEKLKKLENKDYNFKKLRDMNDEEKAKLSTVEIELKQKQEELEESQKSFKSQIVESNKNEALAVLVGNDEALRKKVLYNYDRLKGDAVTKDEINSRMRDAYNMLGQAAPQVNVLGQAVNYQGVSSTGKKEKVDKDLASKLGLTEEDLTKHNLKI